MASELGRSERRREPLRPDTNMANKSDPVCYLCGNVIERNPHGEEMKLSMDHIPPRQFFPQPLRKETNLNLDVAPSHKKCNNAYKDDEDYFYHSLYPLVANANTRMAKAIFSDFMRRSEKRQTPAMLRKVFSSASRITAGGIILPAGKIEVLIDERRIQRVAGKIARGVLFLSVGICAPETSIVDMRLCENESEVPDMYQLSWQATPVNGPYPHVFSYRHFLFEGHHIISLLFWEAFMFCITIQGGEAKQPLGL
jgi:hypothetical protein